MKTPSRFARRAVAAAVLTLSPLAALAYDSGSTGVDGAFHPTVNTVLQLPPNGVFNFTTVDIPAGVTVSFNPNVTNTPVTLLASGNVTIAGTLHVNGGWSTPVGASGDGNIGDDGMAGSGGPGGYDGGTGGVVESENALRGGDGLGPGGGQGGIYYGRYGVNMGGGGGGFATGGGVPYYYWRDAPPVVGGVTYGSSLLLPLIGGSGGGGADGGPIFGGSGGGGGGGALLIASSGTVNVTGSVQAYGGGSGGASGVGVGGTGGGGSGGAIRIVATTISGNGSIVATGGGSAIHPYGSASGGAGGGIGRIRLEAENMLRTANTNPGYTFGQPGPAFLAGLPALRITSVAGVAAPAQPTGSADIVLPIGTANPVAVVVETVGVPVGNTVKITIAPQHGATTSVVTPALTGTTDAASATVAVDLPSGPSTLRAETTYTIVAALGDALSTYAMGERVEKVRLAAAMNGASTVTLITVSGKEYTLPSHVPLMPLG